LGAEEQKSGAKRRLFNTIEPIQAAASTPRT
jgi:hypothetical protein